MPNKLHSAWITAKESLEKEVKYFKEHGGLVAKPVEDALKTFTKGFGPQLDTLAAAYKSKKDAEIKKQATKAKEIGDKYMQTLKTLAGARGISSARASAIRTAENGLDGILKSLVILEQRGSGAPNVF